MKKLTGWIYLNRTIEESIFSIILLAGVPYFVLNEILNLSSNRLLIIFFIDFLMLAVFLFLLRLSIRKSLTQQHIFYFSIFILLMFALFWPNSTGLTASSSYVFLTLIVALPLINKGKAKIFFVLSLVGFILVAGFAPIEYHQSISYPEELIAYFLNFAGIALILLVFKAALNREHSSLEKRIEKLNQLNAEIDEQNQELENQKQSILRIQNHLQEIINDRTEKIEKENERLIEYAFINAHLVRAPLANLIGLCQIKMQEKPSFQKIFDRTQKLDLIIRKIAGVLSISEK